MTESALAVLIMVVLGWAVVSDRLARWNITGPLVFTVGRLLLGNPDWGPAVGRCRRPVDPSARGVDARAPAVLGCGEGERLEAQARRSVSRAAARHRPAPLGDPRLARRGVALRRFHLGTRRLRRRHTGSHRCRTQRPGDQRRADPYAGAPRPQCGEWTQRRHRHPDRRVHAGRRCRSSSGSPEHGAARTVAGALLELAVGLLVGLAVGLGAPHSSRSRRDGTGSSRGAAPGDTCRRPRQLRPRGRRSTATGSSRRSWPGSPSGRRSRGRRRSWTRSASSGTSGRGPGARRVVPLRRRPGAGRVRVLLGVDPRVRRVEPHGGPHRFPSHWRCSGPGWTGGPSCSSGGSGRGASPRSCSHCWRSRSSATSAVVGQAVSAVAFTVLLSVVVHGVSAGPLGRRYALGHGDSTANAGEPGPRSRRESHRSVPPRAAI